MASGIDKLAQQIAGLLKKDSPDGYDTTATVKRVEGGTAWVHIPGGVDETPVRMTVNANVGDNVQVRVSGGRAFIVGNGTAPPTDDGKAKELHAISSKAIGAVKGVADKAFKIAGNTAQYFWTTEEGSDTGAHITEIPKESFEADPEHGGANLLLRSIGIAIRQGLVELASFSVAGMHVNTYDSQGNEVTIAHLGYGEGNAQSGTAEAPYYTLGIRKSGADIGNYSVVEGEENEASYYCAHAEGYETKASDTASHAEGSLTKASNVYSHAEGIFTTASGGASHSEGDTTTASGMNAHAEGGNTVASGWNSHAAGHGTIAQRAHQTVVGEYNVADTGGSDALDRGTYAFIVGNGTSDSARSNGFTVDWNGTGRFEGSVIAKDYTGTKRMPASSASSDGGRVGWIQSMHSGSNYVLRVSGQYGTTGTTYNTHDFIASASDVRLKKNVEDCEVEDALSVINRIRMRSFDWLHTDEHQKIGFIADELEQIDPKLSVGGGTERDGTVHYKSVDTFYMMGYLVKAVQELSTEVERLRRELNGNHSES